MAIATSISPVAPLQRRSAARNSAASPRRRSQSASFRNASARNAEQKDGSRKKTPFGRSQVRQTSELD